MSIAALLLACAVFQEPPDRERLQSLDEAEVVALEMVVEGLRRTRFNQEVAPEEVCAACANISLRTRQPA